MITEKQLHADVMNGLRAAGFAYGENNDDYAGEPYDTPAPEVSMGDLKIYADGDSWAVANGSSTFTGSYTDAVGYFVERVKAKYPDRIRK